MVRHLAVFALALCALPVQAAPFSEVWSAVQQAPYAVKPAYKTSYTSLISGGFNSLGKDADRTLDQKLDLLPRFQKLVHPIGICFAGTWEITEASPYTGYFAEGAKGLIIARASEAMGYGDRGDYRAFGFAGKIFPTADRNAQTTSTANFFTVDDLGGTKAKSYLDLAKTNEPETSVHLSQFALIPALTKIAKTFALADSNPGIRQVYEIGELGLADPSQARSPRWLSIVPENTERNGAIDFRDELRLVNFPGGLRFGIHTADAGGQWQRLGTITLKEEALSDGCDHRLHFHHPRWKN